MTGALAARKTVTQAVAVGLLLLAWILVPRSGLPLPSPEAVWASLARYTASGELPRKTLISVEAIAAGLGLSLGLALVLTGVALLSRVAGRVVDAATTIMHPLPELALLPLVILWVGIGFEGILFLVVNSALWPLIVNCTAGFRAVPPIYPEVGRNIGLGRLRLITSVMIPATTPYLITGFKTSWARAWRTVIGAEMVTGISAKAGGLGWFIYEAHYEIDMARILAGILVIVAIGLLVERGLFEVLEAKTIQRWGMTR